MIYDIFSFNAELDLLELRLEMLSPHVDKFVIIEATETFSGVAKPLYYAESADRFKAFKEKVVHHVVDDTPKSFTCNECDQDVLREACNSSNVTREHLCWLKEFYQKECIQKALSQLSDDDFCYISDLDEFWNPDMNLDMTRDVIYKPKINNCYINYLNVMVAEDWTYFTGPIAAKYSQIKNRVLNHLRTRSKMVDEYEYVEDFGWHFNAIVGVDRKIESFQHPVYTRQYMSNRSRGSWVDESKLPEFIIENRDKYSKFFKQIK
jgi:hypothetical protein